MQVYADDIITYAHAKTEEHVTQTLTAAMSSEANWFTQSCHTLYNSRIYVSFNQEKRH